MSQPSAIEQFKQQSDAIRLELDALKVLNIDSEKETKKAEIEAAKKKLDADIQLKLKETSLETQDREELEKIAKEVATLDITTTSLTSLNQEVQETLEESNEPETTTEPEPEGFWGKTKAAFSSAGGFIKDQWTDVQDGEKWKTETGKNSLRLAGFGLTGIGLGILAYKGIKSLREKWKARKERKAAKKAEKEKKEKEKKTVRGKVKTGLKWAGGILAGGLGVSLVAKNRNKLKEWRGNLRGKKREDGDGTGAHGGMSDIENGVKSFEKLKDQNIDKYNGLNDLGNAVNGFYDNVYSFEDGNTVTSLDELEKYRLGGEKDKYPGVIPHILENSFETVEEMNSQKSLITLWAYGKATDLKNALAGGVSSVTAKVVNGVLSIFGFGSDGTEEKVKEKVKEFFAGKNSPEDLQIIFRKILKTMTYLNYVDNVDFITKIENKVNEGYTFYEISEDGVPQKMNLSDDMQKSRKKIHTMQYYMDNFKFAGTDGEIHPLSDLADFKQTKLSETMKSTQTSGYQDILNYNPSLKESIDSYNKKRNVVKKEFSEGNKEKQKQILDQMSGDAEDELSNAFLVSVSRYVPLLNFLPPVNKAQIRKKIKEDAGFKQQLQAYMIQFQSLKGEIDKPNPDYIMIQKKIDTYYASVKEISVADLAMQEIQKEGEDGKWMTFAMMGKDYFTGLSYSFMHGFKNLFDGNAFSGLGYIYGGTVSTLPITALVGHNTIPLLSASRNSIYKINKQLVTKPIQWAYKGSKWAGKKVKAGYNAIKISRSSPEIVSAITNNLTLSSDALGYRDLWTATDDQASLAKKIYDSLIKSDGRAVNGKKISEITAKGNPISKKEFYDFTNDVANEILKARSASEKAVEKSGSIFSNLKNRMQDAYSNIAKKMTPSQRTAASQEMAETKTLLDNASSNPTQKNITALKKLRNNPTFKAALRRSPFLIDGVINIFTAYGLHQEAQHIREMNIERGTLRGQKSMIIGTLGGVEVGIFVLGVANARNPGGWVIMIGVGAAEGIKYGINQYYDVVESYYRNFEDFKREHVAKIKQEIISKRSWSESIEVSFKEEFADLVGSIFQTNLNKNKDMRATITIQEALRALIYLEELENYPYAGMDLNKVPEDFQAEINRQKKFIEGAVIKRFDYIEKEYKDKFVSKASLEHSQGIEDINRVLLESREYVAMKNNNPESNVDLATYKANIENELKSNTLFLSLESLYQQQPHEFYLIAGQIGYLKDYLNYEGSNLENLDLINTNLAYFEKYFHWKTLGKLSSEMKPGKDLVDMEDLQKLEIFFSEGNLKHQTVTTEVLSEKLQLGTLDIYTADRLEREFKTSTNLGQNVLYKIATEVLGGYQGNNSLEELQAYYSELNKESTGIYYSGKSWYVNRSFKGLNFLDWRDKKICGNEELNDPKSIKKMISAISDIAGVEKKIITTSPGGLRQNTETYGMLVSDAKTGDLGFNKNYGKLMIDVISGEIEFRSESNVSKIKQQSIDFIKNNSHGNYIALPRDMIIDLTRAGFASVGLYYYKFENNQIKAIETIKGALPDYHATGSEKNPLIDSIEIYATETFELSENSKRLLSSIDIKSERLEELIKLDGEDINLGADIKAIIDKKNQEWSTFKIYLQHLKPELTDQVLATEIEEWESFYNTAYITLLSLSSTGKSNDVKGYDNFIKFSNQIASEMISCNYSAGNTMVQVQVPGFTEHKEFDNAIRSQKLPNTGKTIYESVNSDNEIDKTLGKKGAQLVLQSILEAQMLTFEGNNMKSLTNLGNRGINRSVLDDRLKINLSQI